TRIVWGETPEIRAHMTDGRVENCGLGQLDSFVILDLAGRAREDVETIEVAVDCPMLRDGIVLIDTPGVCDHASHTARAEEAIAGADLVVLVLNASQLLIENQHHLAVDWMVKTLGKPVVPVVNWMNVVEECDRDELRRRIDQWSRAHLPAVLGR